MQSTPYTYKLKDAPNIVPSRYDSHIIRRLTDMKNQFYDQDAYDAMLAAGNPILYEVYEVLRPVVPGELMQGVSVVHPGKVSAEYYMTKGHFHTILETAEVYICLHGQGYVVMESPEGEWAVEPLRPHTVLYVPPGWAHRSVNTGPSEDLVTFFVYPANAGHDYGSIEKQGYRKLVVAGNSPQIIDNPR